VFERFTDRARRVVVLSQEEARRLNHNYIGTEHLLLGLIREEDSIAARAIASFHVSLADVRSKVEGIVGRGGTSPSGHIPFTPRAKKVLELALREALALQHNYIGTEHMLLGVIREGEGVAAQVLRELDVDLVAVRQRVVELLSGYTRPSEVEGTLANPIPSRTGPKPAECGFCGTPSPECGTLYTGTSGALICEHCLDREVVRRVDAPSASTLPLWPQLGPSIAEILATYTTTGPPPNDEEAARAEVIDVFLRRGELSEDGTALPNVEGGENLGVAQQEVERQYGAFIPRTETIVEVVKFVNERQAIVYWSSTFNGQPVRGPQFTALVLVDGDWKVTRDSMCQQFASIGIPFPPEPPAG
jgi:hypothetical protein